MAEDSGFSKYFNNRVGMLIGIVAVIVLAILAYQFILTKKTVVSSQPNTTSKPVYKTTSISEIKEKIKQSNFVYTDFALCRMECRNISKDEVNEILRRGKFASKKSDLNAKPCPSYAFGWSTPAYELVIAVFVVCDDGTKLTTVYPMGSNDPPSCSKCR